MPIPAQTGSLGSKVLTDTASALAAQRNGHPRPGDSHPGIRRATAVGDALTTVWNPADHLPTGYEGALAPDRATPFNLLIVQSTSFRNVDCDCCYLPLPGYRRARSRAFEPRARSPTVRGPRRAMPLSDRAARSVRFLARDCS